MVHYTRSIDTLGATLVDLMSFFAGPQRDDALLREAGVDLDRALFPILVRLASRGPLSVAALADQVGRDHTTISHQLSKLESLELISRQGDGSDRRVRTARLTPEGDTMARAILAARQRLLSGALADWSDADLTHLAVMNRRLVEALSAAAHGRK
jgi:DNA-binding MarR family transcriptional regulator